MENAWCSRRFTSFDLSRQPTWVACLLWTEEITSCKSAQSLTKIGSSLPIVWLIFKGKQEKKTLLPRLPLENAQVFWLHRSTAFISYAVAFFPHSGGLLIATRGSISFTQEKRGGKRKKKGQLVMNARRISSLFFLYALHQRIRWWDLVAP